MHAVAHAWPLRRTFTMTPAARTAASSRSRVTPNFSQLEVRQWSPGEQGCDCRWDRLEGGCPRW